MPDAEDVDGTVLGHDVVRVMGGPVANLLAVRRLHGLDAVMRRAWREGVVLVLLSGVGAGSICWSGAAPPTSPLPDCARSPTRRASCRAPAGALRQRSGRRPLIHGLVALGTRPGTHCTDDGVGLVYRGTRPGRR